MTGIDLVKIVEGALMAAGKPLTVVHIAELFEEHERPETTAIRFAIATSMNDINLGYAQINPIAASMNKVSSQNL